ncbi:hypothetical protein [Veillonella agrestimuris]|uniref:hypothetical protein n=1 Tax=Veillonella agrestimuris TaxID=2941340 RepID=UPI002040DA0F|nr:hypothetical protein [Veillonella agrestimuris]
MYTGTDVVREVVEALEIGHEIEVKYNGVVYGLVDHKEGWQLAVGRQILAVSRNPYELFEASLLEGLSMKYILENMMHEDLIIL